MTLFDFRGVSLLRLIYHNSSPQSLCLFFLIVEIDIRLPQRIVYLYVLGIYMSKLHVCIAHILFAERSSRWVYKQS
ncbi:hypothetical protein CROQUDRAFT_594169 [Cronartium quercuum f. sp. fusiforme G11]|uniref:Uncharacterized protein n=1 Tax=Cronartium quercuum f. sp. fusiforme G11 TaxID=708437 RepID=A0A9P6NIY3_9BASI|nr:hypothetical protein CROQUDRAFT_594169 [Cronartium quercuum f. sp. fusiforme G11]